MRLNQFCITAACLALQPQELAGEPPAAGLFSIEPCVPTCEAFEFAG